MKLRAMTIDGILEVQFRYNEKDKEFWTTRAQFIIDNFEKHLINLAAKKKDYKPLEKFSNGASIVILDGDCSSFAVVDKEENVLRIFNIYDFEWSDLNPPMGEHVLIGSHEHSTIVFPDGKIEQSRTR